MNTRKLKIPYKRANTIALGNHVIKQILNIKFERNGKVDPCNQSRTNGKREGKIVVITF